MTAAMGNAPGGPIDMEAATWFDSHTRHHAEFPIGGLLELKAAKRLKLGLAIPTLNEAASIAAIVASARRALVDECPLLDEILVVDSGSTDATMEIAAAAGADVHAASAILPGYPCPGGKGENLWKAGFVSNADILCFIDGDILNFQPGFCHRTARPAPVRRLPALFQGILHAPAGAGRQRARPGRRPCQRDSRPAVFQPLFSGAPRLHPAAQRRVCHAPHAA